MYICICNGVTERQITKSLMGGVACVEELACRLGLGVGCGRCKEWAARMLEEHASAANRRSVAGS